MLVSEERYSPGAFDLPTGYEHIHRYLFAKRYTDGKKVLDLASGEGYGSDLLAQGAAQVIGIEINPDAVSHAKATYQRKNLSFHIGSIDSVPLNQLFDVVVCFEALEHILNHTLLFQEVKRLLKPDGMFIVSTPNKWVYSEKGITKNQYHLKEIDLPELQKLLLDHFKYQFIYGQKSVVSSRVFPLQANAKVVEEERIEMMGDRFSVTTEEERFPRYLIGLGSDMRIEWAERTSYLADVAPREDLAQWVMAEKGVPSKRRGIMKKLGRWILDLYLQRGFTQNV